MPLPGALSKGFMAHSVWRMCRRKQNFSENIFPNRNTACRFSVVRRRETYRTAWGENVSTSFNLIIIIKNSLSKTFIFSLSWIPVAIASWWFDKKKNTTKHTLQLRIIEVKTIKEKVKEASLIFHLQLFGDIDKSETQVSHRDIQWKSLISFIHLNVLGR